MAQFLMRFESTATLMNIQLIILNKSHTAFHKWYGLCPQLIFFIWKYLAVLAWKPSVGWNVVSTMRHACLRGCLGNVVQMHVYEKCVFYGWFLKGKKAFCIFFPQPIITRLTLCPSYCSATKYFLLGIWPFCLNLLEMPRKVAV